MDGVLGISYLGLAVFLAALFVAALVAGVTGFAFALIAAAVWLHILTPLETATLTVSYGLLVQAYGVWKLRHAFYWDRLWPFVLGGAPGVAMGVFVLRWANPSYMRMGIAAFLMLYAIYNLAGPELSKVRAGKAADTAAGFVGAMLGSMAGFPGILIVLWCSLRDWPRDVQRAVFQTASVALLAMSALTLGVTGSIAIKTIYLFLFGLPALVLGTLAGFRLYGKLDDAIFRRMVLWLLLAAGLFLLVSLR